MFQRKALTRHTPRSNPAGTSAQVLIDRAAGRRPHPSAGFVAELAAAVEDRTDTVRIPRIVLTASAAL